LINAVILIIVFHL